MPKKPVRKTPARKTASKEDQLIEAVNRLDATTREWMEKYGVYHRISRSLTMFFIRGVLYGFGILVAIVIVIPLFIEILRWIEWVPLLGDFFLEVLNRMEQVNQVRTF